MSHPVPQRPRSGKILGIHDGHNSAAALVIDGKLAAAVQEERLTGVKNQGGFPLQAIRELDRRYSLGDVELVVLAAKYFGGGLWSRRDVLTGYARASKVGIVLKEGLKLIPGFLKGYRLIRGAQRVPRGALDFCRTPPVCIDHHTAHASTAYYGNGAFDSDVLVLTCDGSGDGLSASVSIGSRGSLTRRHSVPEHSSLGRLYSYLTYLFGMVPYEHEYKIMGLAPYCTDEPKIERCVEKFRLLFEWEGSEPRWRYAGRYPSVQAAGAELRDIFESFRFDVVAAGLQRFLEEMLTEWVRRAVALHGVSHVACAGGVFMNVKANKLIAELPAVERLFVFPSCGDESNCIGAANWGWHTARGVPPAPLSHFYLWDDPLEVPGETLARQGLQSRVMNDPAREIAELLAAGHVVGRVAGGMEFGARALGNRSLLADPSKPQVVREINDMIKGRDFWMPFAPSVLEEDFAKYFEKNPAAAGYEQMMFAADSVAGHRSELAAALHPYDYTGRPHVVRAEANPEYHRLISEFKRLTGRGVILNTSLNLHGLPMVRDAGQAIAVMLNSGLRYLAVDRLLIIDERADKSFNREAAANG